ncbi:unnamed protein product [Clonostachys rosea]|uniref:NmrA-like domain-containing protein n=1 Tax=Bionectria ochroleuca TaxID=29856 RepID=A0ABY6UNV8_BIOOC|nr:unnamed protein product [Clonostachys rosea]
MTRIVTVVGATGNQGGSVVAALLDNPAFSIRAITRNSESQAAKDLANKGVEVVEADLNDVGSLKSAFAGSHAIFAMTNFFESLSSFGIEMSMQKETALGINLANAAADTDSLEHYVWSTLPNSRENSGAKAIVPYYESKNQVDRHIKSIPHLLQKTTFVWFAWYISNLQYPIYRPTPVNGMDGAKSFIQVLGVPPATLVPVMGDEKKNIGLFVKSILEQPHKTLPGKIVSGVTEHLSFEKILTHLAPGDQTKAHSLQISKEGYSRLWPMWGEVLHLTHEYFAQVGSESFTSTEQHVLTKDDLNVEGLIDSAEALSKINIMEREGERAKFP